MEERYARQILAFGEDGQQKIRSTQVGIVGLGGVGSQVVQSLAYLGVGAFVLVDDDRVVESNLNRLVGAVPADAPAGTLKTEVAGRLIRQVNPAAQVCAIPRNLRTQEALDALSRCPVIFGCVDHDAPRLILMELAAAYEAVLIDVASEIDPASGSMNVFGGRVVVARPGQYCLDCASQIDMEVAKKELDDLQVAGLRKAHGYGLGEQGAAAAVVSLNGVVANLAVTEFLTLVTGLRTPFRQLNYHGWRGKVTVGTDVRKEGCYTCGYLVGKREQANIWRYAKE